MKNITKSLAIIAAAAAIVVGGSIAYFSDTDVSGNNTFTAGTLEIDVDGTNGVWEDGFTLDDMKPCYTDYINFKINNTGNNPVDITKKLVFEVNQCDKENGVNEPECEAYGGVYSIGSNDEGICTGGTNIIGDQRNDIESIINYDLSVEVYDGDNKIWWQTIYTDDDNKTLADIYGNEGSVYLGMIPEGGYMLVTQSYHMKDSDQSQNQYQSDQLAFNITIEGKQITGSATLENKTGDPDWKIIDDDFAGTLTYEVKHPTFDFTFTGKAPQSGQEYDLVVITDIANDKGVVLGTETANASGDIVITGDVNIGNAKDAKVWLIPHGDLDVTTGNWSGWHLSKCLWETGLIWYEDTDL